MTLSEMIAAFYRLLKEHGDLPVYHHDDWEDFLVESITFKPRWQEHDAAGQVTWDEEPHILLTGDQQMPNTLER